MSDDKKFYQESNFKKLKNKWYDKLADSGFDDIEWHNPKTGYGQNSSFMRSRNSPPPYKIRSASFPQIRLHHFRISRNFLEHGAFLRKKAPKRSKKHLITTFYHQRMADPHTSAASLASAAGVSEQYTYPEYLIWQFYCDGLTTREISTELRQLIESDQAYSDCPTKQKNPYSQYTIIKRIKYLRAEMLYFQQTSPDAIDDRHTSLIAAPSCEDLLIAAEAGEASEAGEAAEGTLTPVDWKKAADEK